VQNEGKAVSMPQGNKKPSTPVSINKLSGTFKKGGNVSSKKLQNAFMNENAPAMKSAKKDSNEVYSVYAGKKKDKHFVGGGHAEGDASDNVSDLAYEAVMKAEKSGKKTMIDPKEGSVTESEREVVRKTAPKRYPSGMTDEEISDFLTTNLMRRLYQHHIDKKNGGKVGK